MYMFEGRDKKDTENNILVCSEIDKHFGCSRSHFVSLLSTRRIMLQALLSQIQEAYYVRSLRRNECC